MLFGDLRQLIDPSILDRVAVQKQPSNSSSITKTRIINA